MRAVRYHEYGGPEVLRVDEVARPSPDHGELLVDVRAASVNPVDALYREGVLGSDAEGAFEGSLLPAVTGTDLAGVVAAVGPGVEGFEAGDRAFGTGMAAVPEATFAEYATVPADHVARLSDPVSFDRAAAAAHVGGTAWRTVVEFGDVSPGDTALIHGGSGGVGHLAVQLAAAAGGDVVATAGSERARSAVADLGASAVLDYGRDDLAAAVREAAGGSVDFVLDAHTGEYLDLDIAVAANGGTIAHIDGGFPEMPHPNATRTKELTIQGVAMHNTPDIATVMTRLDHLLAAGDLTVLIDRTYDLAEAAAAQRAVAEAPVVGKVVVAP